MNLTDPSSLVSSEANNCIYHLMLGLGRGGTKKTIWGGNKKVGGYRWVEVVVGKSNREGGDMTTRDAQREREREREWVKERLKKIWRRNDDVFSLAPKEEQERENGYIQRVSVY